MRLPSLAAGTDLAVDLGTANTVVFRRGEGIVLFEPSVVAMDQQTGQVYAVGEKARQMLGRTPATIVATRRGRKLIAVVLDSPNIYGDARTLLNLGFSHT